MPFTYLSHLECSGCGTTHDASTWQGLCACGQPLLARYDLERLAEHVSPQGFASRRPTLWRYHELLPVTDAEHAISLGEGVTPLTPLPRLAKELGLGRLHLKDEGLLPTGTFKARGASVGVSRARELGRRRIAMPTNGNAGAAWATYAARADCEALIVMPVDAPLITRSECVATGARLVLVDGLIGDAGAMVARAVADEGWTDVSTLKEPYRLEGKKTMGLELFEQLGWRVPDVIIYPTGGGVGLIGIFKALRELQALGWLSQPKMPRLVAVQAEGCAPVVRAFDNGDTQTSPWEDAHTVAFGITVPKPLGDRLILDAIRQTNGCAIAVSDEELLADVRLLARLEGVFACPEGAATVSAARRLRAEGWLSEDDEVVLLNTGSGLKYPDAVVAEAPILQPGEPIPIELVGSTAG